MLLRSESAVQRRHCFLGEDSFQRIPKFEFFEHSPESKTVCQPRFRFDNFIMQLHFGQMTYP